MFECQKKGMQFHSNAAILLCIDERFVQCSVCTHSNKLVHCWFLVFFPLLLLWNVSLFIYLFSFWSFEQQKRERAEEVRNVCRFIYKLLFKCWSIIWSNVALWKIGFCILKSMMHVRDWCVQRIVHLVLFSLLYSFASRAWKVFVVFSNCISFAKWWNFFLSEITFCFGIIFAIFSWFNVNA